MLSNNKHFMLNMNSIIKPIVCKTYVHKNNKIYLINLLNVLSLDKANIMLNYYAIFSRLFNHNELFFVY